MARQKLSLLVVEDEKPLAHLWAEELAPLVEPTLAHSIAEAKQRLQDRAFDAMLLDLHLPDGFGLEVLQEVTHRGSDTAVIIMTGNGDLNSAIQALRLGACDYLLKPCKIAELERHLQRIAREQEVRNQNIALRQQIQTLSREPSQTLVGASGEIRNVKRLIDKVAPTDTSVLIQGETGTGKEVVARLIHEQSRRREGNFVPINCAALPRDLAESELFGHRKGAFTGADRDHRGLVQVAAQGTLFLDEIGDMPLELQSKFLRLLEGSEGRRVGDAEPYRTDVRIVAATNRDLRADSRSGRFREDLYYRLQAFEVRLPPLRQIPADLPAIAQYLLETIKVPTATAQHFSDAALASMRAYPWPGNVRELRNVVERAKILCEEEEVLPEHLNLAHDPMPFIPFGSSDATAAPVAAPPLITLAEMEKRMIEQALRVHAGNKTATARALGVSLRTLYNKLDSP